MEHELSYHYRQGRHPQGGDIRSPIISIRAETSDEFELQHGSSSSFSGKLIGMTPQQIVELKFREDLQVIFKGKGYKFSSLDKDGAFELRADGCS
jgi:hypothetical protein